MPADSTVFLTAQWRNLVVLNYEIDPRLLRSLVPSGTELDFWNDRTFVSLVGFQFLQTRLSGWLIPFHRKFDEVNLRFYVRRKSGSEWRRGVVFIKEIVPRFFVTLIARWIYNEQYVTRPMRSRIQLPEAQNGRRGSLNYSWKSAGKWCELGASISGEPIAVDPGSAAEFITEHYWGYTVQRDKSTLEYQVEHHPWRVWPAESSRFTGDVLSLYGSDFANVLASAPDSAFVADGSGIVVRKGQRVAI